MNETLRRSASQLTMNTADSSTTVTIQFGDTNTGVDPAFFKRGLEYSKKGSQVQPQKLRIIVQVLEIPISYTIHNQIMHNA